MTKRIGLLLCALTCVSLGLSCATSKVSSTSPVSKKPNIVFILADDLGYTDLGCTGSDLYQTPHIDRLASQSLYFDQAHSSHPTCSPSRAAIMSGKYPARLGIVSHGKPGTVVEGSGNFLAAEEYTLAEALKAAGYYTGHIGKWHVGMDPANRPEAQGFDFVKAANKFCCPGSFFYPYVDKKATPGRRALSDVPDLEDRGPEDHLTEVLGEEAVAFINEHAQDDQPFFLNLWYYAVHTPIQAEADKVAKYNELRQKDAHHRNPRYAGLVEHLDDSMGAVLQALEDNGLSENTIVVFFSDNGGANYGGITSNYPLREGKVTQYLGGTRVPLFVHWPGVTPAGQVCHEPVIGHDLYPTLLKMVGVAGNSQQNKAMDGQDLTPLLKDPQAELERDSLHWLRYPVVFHYRKDARVKGPCGTIVKGDWKMMEFFETPHGLKYDVELYNIKADISQTKNLAADMPEKVEELQQTMRTWRREVKAPDYQDAYKAYEAIKNPK